MRDDTAVGQHYVELDGEYDLARKDELTAVFASITNGAPVTIDMTRVTYVDSSFLNELATMRVRLNGRPVTLIGVQPNIARVLQITKLDRFFTLQAAQ
ncbi:MAG TPA: STAS domain-containing protein [Candidatus Babeliales bacterium]|nr:STAS domain-containing protein [Candidatus Babeliales bacterium]